MRLNEHERPGRVTWRLDPVMFSKTWTFGEVSVLCHFCYPSHHLICYNRFFPQKNSIIMHVLIGF